MWMKLAFLGVFALSVAGNGYQLFIAGGAKPKCQVQLAAQVNQQTNATQADQAKADADTIAQLKNQIKKRDDDAKSDAGIQAALHTRVYAQEETLQHVYDTDKLAKVCLAAPVPDALLGSLQQRPAPAAKPPG